MKREEKLYLAFLGPVGAVMLIVIGLPLLYAGYLSLRHYSLLIGTDRFIGFANYIKVFQDKDFLDAAVRTVGYLTVVVVIEGVLGLLIALLVSQIEGIGRSFLTIIVMLPMLLLPVVAATFWRMVMYNPPYEEFNRIFHLPISILASKQTALWGIMLVDIWQWSPWVFLPFLGALEALPQETIEASQIDGANTPRIVWSVVLPLIKPVVIVILSIRAISTFLIFSYVWVMTEGGPGSATHTLSTHIYKETFKLLNYGYGASMGIIMMLIAMGLSAGLFIYATGHQMT